MLCFANEKSSVEIFIDEILGNIIFALIFHFYVRKTHISAFFQVFDK